MKQAFVGAQIHDGKRLFVDHAVVDTGAVPAILPRKALPRSCPVTTLEGGVILPGFVDLQVNGGGGRMISGTSTIADLADIAAAHATQGVAAILPTLITDTPDATRQVIDTTIAAVRQGAKGILGLHLEGPHLDPRRNGAHAACLIRPLEKEDMALLLHANDNLPNLKITLAPESVRTDQIAQLSAAGVLVSLGHSDCDYDTAMRAFDAGARCTTHLFNAMSQLGHRTPGLVGATLTAGQSCGIIADGIHVHPASLRIALAALPGPDGVFLVSDAMACAGTDMTAFTLGGREITRRDGRLTLSDGTLAGADLHLSRAIEVLVTRAGDPLETAISRATSIPASLLRDAMGHGSWPQTIGGLNHISSLGAIPRSLA